jgi:hypothetical protein
MKSLRFFIIACVLLLMRLPAYGCSCIFPPNWDSVNDPIKWDFAWSSFAGIITVISIEPAANNTTLSMAQGSGVWITARVEKSWKGTTEGTIRFYDYLNTISCGRYSIASYDIRKQQISINDTSVRRHLIFLPNTRGLLATIPTCRGASRGWDAAYEQRVDSLAKIPGVLSSIATGSIESALHTTIAPNPSADQTTLSFSLAKPATVTVELFNALGEHVRTAFRSELKPAGTHREPMDVSTLPAGVYCCRIRTEEGIAMQRVVVLR